MKKLSFLLALAACEAHQQPTNTTVTVEPPAAAAPAPTFPTTPREPLEIAPDLADRLAKFAVIPIGIDDSKLDARAKSMLKKLVQAAQLLQVVFLRQGDAKNLVLRQQLAADPRYKDALMFFDFMGGPWDRTEPDQRAVIGTRKKPPGGDFYPEELGKDQIEKWLAQHPPDKDAFQSYFTVIRLAHPAGLRAIPFSEAYREQLEPAARLLKEAAALADDNAHDV